MRQLIALTVVETKLALRETLNWLVVVILPTAVLLGVGSLFAPHEPDPLLGGARFIDLLVPSRAVPYGPELAGDGTARAVANEERD